MITWFKDQLRLTKLYFHGIDGQQWPPALLTITAITACVGALFLPSEFMVLIMLGWFSLIFWALNSN